MNPALSQEFHIFCEQEQLQNHATLNKNPYCVYGTLKWSRVSLGRVTTNNYSPDLQEDARRFEVRLNRVSARQFGIKDMLDGHAGAEDVFGGIVWEVTRVV